MSAISYGKIIDIDNLYFITKMNHLIFSFIKYGKDKVILNENDIQDVKNAFQKIDYYISIVKSMLSNVVYNFYVTNSTKSYDWNIIEKCKNTYATYILDAKYNVAISLIYSLLKSYFTMEYEQVIRALFTWSILTKNLKYIYNFLKNNERMTRICNMYSKAKNYKYHLARLDIRTSSCPINSISEDHLAYNYIIQMEKLCLETNYNIYCIFGKNYFCASDNHVLQSINAISRERKVVILSTYSSECECMLYVECYKKLQHILNDRILHIRYLYNVSDAAICIYDYPLGTPLNAFFDFVRFVIANDIIDQYIHRYSNKRIIAIIVEMMRQILIVCNKLSLQNMTLSENFCHYSIVRYSTLELIICNINAIRFEKIDKSIYADAFSTVLSQMMGINKREFDYGKFLKSSRARQWKWIKSIEPALNIIFYYSDLSVERYKMCKRYFNVDAKAFANGSKNIALQYIKNVFSVTNGSPVIIKRNGELYKFTNIISTCDIDEILSFNWRFENESGIGIGVKREIITKYIEELFLSHDIFKKLDNDTYTLNDGNACKECDGKCMLSLNTVAKLLLFVFIANIKYNTQYMPVNVTRFTIKNALYPNVFATYKSAFEKTQSTDALESVRILISDMHLDDLKELDAKLHSEFMNMSLYGEKYENIVNKKQYWNIDINDIARNLSKDEGNKVRLSAIDYEDYIHIYCAEKYQKNMPHYHIDNSLISITLQCKLSHKFVHNSIQPNLNYSVRDLLSIIKIDEKYINNACIFSTTIFETWLQKLSKKELRSFLYNISGSKHLRTMEDIHILVGNTSYIKISTCNNVVLLPAPIWTTQKQVIDDIYLLLYSIVSDQTEYNVV